VEHGFERNRRHRRKWGERLRRIGSRWRLRRGIGKRRVLGRRSAADGVDHH
jgi:hypothetical protein